MQHARKTSLFVPALLVILFGYFLHESKFISLLCLAALFLSMAPWFLHASYDELKDVLGFHRCPAIWIVAGTLDGVLLGMLLRWVNEKPLIISSVEPFLLVAAAIGITEELVFRGYIFGRLQSSYGNLTSVSLSSFFHTAYKLAIFLPFSSIPLLHLGLITFLAGMVLGYSRVTTKSIWPCVAFHAVFDLWVYGDQTTPWWVW